MVTTRLKANKIQTEVWAVDEYIDPLGAHMPPWGKPWLLSQRMAEKVGFDPVSVMFFQIPDDSMATRMNKGDIVLVDCADVHPEDGKPFLIQHRTGARVRRLFLRQDGGLIISPDSRSSYYTPETLAPDVVKSLRIVGKVLFVASYTV